MRHDVRIIGFLVGLVATSLLQSCRHSADDCEQNGRCVNGTDGVGGGGAGAAGSTTTPGECEDSAECDDGNPCTIDACLSRHCEQTPAADGPPASGTACLTCQDGQPVLAGAEKLCEGDGVCDGAGACAACGQDHPCPDGYGCSSGGSCIEGLGLACNNDTACVKPGASCDPGASQCCLDTCGNCKRCSPVDFASCEPIPVNEHGPSCTAQTGSACDGKGNCLNDVQEPCTSSSQCASGLCAGNHCKYDDGQSCTSSSQCASGNCLAGVCSF